MRNIRQNLVFAFAYNALGVPIAPPPGYFGPGDAGLCHHVDTPVVLAVNARTTPAIAGCFGGE